MAGSMLREMRASPTICGTYSDRRSKLARAFAHKVKGSIFVFHSHKISQIKGSQLDHYVLRLPVRSTSKLCISNKRFNFSHCFIKIVDQIGLRCIK